MEGENQNVAEGNSIKEVSLEFFSNVKEATFEKPVFEKATDAQIVGTPTIHVNDNDKEGFTNDQKPYFKFFFTVNFKTADGKPFRDSYSFSYFVNEDDSKSVYYGTTSSTREFINVAMQYVDGITKDSTTKEILTALTDRKVKIITKKYNGKDKLMVLSYM